MSPPPGRQEVGHGHPQRLGVSHDRAGGSDHRDVRHGRRMGVSIVIPIGRTLSARTVSRAGSSTFSIAASGTTGAPLVIGCKQIARREDPLAGHASRSSIDREVDAAERASAGVRLGDRNPLDLVPDRRVAVAGDDHIHGASRQIAGDLEDL